MLVKFQIFAAQGYTILGNTDRALKILEEYAELVTGEIYPLQLQGDGFFNLIDEWFHEFALGTTLPRDEKMIRLSMIDKVAGNSAFTTLVNEYRFQKIVE